MLALTGAAGRLEKAGAASEMLRMREMLAVARGLVCCKRLLVLLEKKTKFCELGIL